MSVRHLLMFASLAGALRSPPVGLRRARVAVRMSIIEKPVETVRKNSNGIPVGAKNNIIPMIPRAAVSRARSRAAPVGRSWAARGAFSRS